MKVRLDVAVLAAGAVSLLAVLAWRAASAPPDGSRADGDTTPRLPATMTAEEVTAREGAAPPDTVRFPDGTWLPAPNDVADPPPFPGFGGGRPFAPVVRLVTDTRTGMQWYEHADGSYSTVQMVEVEQGGETRSEPGWVVGHPSPTLPIK